MQKRILTLLKDNSLFIAIITTISIAYLSLKENGPVIIQISQIDKLEHAFAYCVLTISWLFFVTKKEHGFKKKGFVLVGCVFLAYFLKFYKQPLLYTEH